MPDLSNTQNLVGTYNFVGIAQAWDGRIAFVLPRVPSPLPLIRSCSFESDLPTRASNHNRFVSVSVATDNHYDFNYQQSRRVDPALRILPGDQLLIECDYDTQDRNQVTMVRGLWRN